ncbi:MAG: TIGR00730 family Rossman fold protein [Pseudobdellovibrionaceae bacterium]
MLETLKEQKEIKSICVYCGSSNAVDEKYKEAARKLGTALGKRGWQLVYGGSRVGLMGITADATLEAGGKAVGIIPRFIQVREIAHEHLTEFHMVETMHERKMMMVERSDAFVVLPGGVGTMDETFEVLTWRQLGLHDKPIIIANIDGYWDHFLALVKNIADEKFMGQEHLGIFSVTDNVEEIPDLIENSRCQTFDPSTKWI